MARKTHLCFVCLGNIVRSPLAENLFVSLSEKAGVRDKYQVDSAGTSNWHVGEPPDWRMKRIASRHGVKINGRARQFKVEDFERFDLILAMDKNNRDTLMMQAPDEQARRKIRLLREFDPHATRVSSIPDPYYGGIDGFDEVYRIIERSCQGLLDALETGESIDIR